MGKIELNKKKKKESLLNTAFSLFTSKGFQNTSISDIVNNAGVAKGTFYLYFKDKYDLRNKLIGHKAGLLFMDAYVSVLSSEITGFEDQIIGIVEHVINQLNNNPSLLVFISKHLSWGLFRAAFQEDTETEAYLAFEKLLQSSGYRFKDPEVMIYMIVEQVSGAIYSPILYQQPVPLEQMKPYIYDAVRRQIHAHIL